MARIKLLFQSQHLPDFEINGCTACYVIFVSIWFKKAIGMITEVTPPLGGRQECTTQVLKSKPIKVFFL